jgi:protein gp37
VNVTDIQWCDSSLNLEMGCDGCELWNRRKNIFHCYAGWLTERRKGRAGWPEEFEKPRIFLDRLPPALRWPDLTGEDRPDKPWLNGLPRLVFLNDMGDTFTESLPEDWLAPVLDQMAASPHQWLVLTKRPRRMAEFFGTHGVPGNFWLGTSVTGPENVKRVEELVGIQGARVLFVSAEPLLREVSLRPWLGQLQWVIGGGESQTGSRPTHPDWFRKLRDECAERRVPFFLKQWGDWAPLSQLPDTAQVKRRLLRRRLPACEFPPPRRGEARQRLYQVGNDVAGAGLDGRVWRDMPRREAGAA